MLMKKNFLRPTPEFFNISYSRLIIGSLIGLLYAFSFYGFLYILREVFRIFSVNEMYDLWILTDEEVSFYNLFFAFISVIFGQSITFQYWIDRPRRIFEKYNYKKTSILNDQRVLNWYFLNWFSKLALVFGLMFGNVFNGGYYVISFYSDYKFIFILIVFVLFLQTWNTIRITFKQKSLKWLLSSALIVSVISFGLSKVNLINYNSINNSLNSKNIYYKYNFELPKSSICNKTEKRSLIENLFVVESKEYKSIIIADRKILEFEDLGQKIREWQSSRYEKEIPFMTYRLNIHKNIKMKYVNKLKQELSLNGVSRIAYAVIPSHIEYDKKYYQDCSFSIYLPNWESGIINLKEAYYELSKFDNIIDIRQNDKLKYIINNSIINIKDIKQTVKELIKDETNYIVRYHINENVNFQQNLNVLTYTKQAIDELRNRFSKTHFNTDYENLDYETKKKVRKKYPFRIFELTKEMKKTLNIN